MPLLAGLGPLGVPELLIIAFVVILIFGVGRLPEVGGAVGRGIREFRKATRDEDTTTDASAKPDGGGASQEGAPAATTTSDAIFCGECGTKNPRSAKFCSDCGSSISAPVG